MANGAFGGGTGSSENPYIIEDALDLVAVGSYPSCTFKLKNNINLGMAPFNTGSGWLPIPSFSGVLDGNNKKIQNLYINRPLSDNIGLFATITNGNAQGLVIKNLCIENANISGKNNVGILTGSLNNDQTEGTIPTTYYINNCMFEGKIKGASYVGGVIGQFTYSGTIASVNTMQDVYSEVFITPVDNNIYFGGIAGYWNKNSNNLVAELNRVLSVSSYTNIINGEEKPLFRPKSFGSVAASLTMTSCFYDNELWEGEATPNTIGKTKAELANGATTNFDISFGEDGNPIWDCVDTTIVRYPMLNAFIPRCYYLKMNDTYWIYISGTWTKVFDELPTVEEALKHGMTSIKDIPLEAWKKIKDKGLTTSLVNFIEYSEGKTKVLDTVMMNKESNVNTAENKNYFSKSMNFANLGDNIVMIRKGVVA